MTIDRTGNSQSNLFGKQLLAIGNQFSSLGLPMARDYADISPISLFTDNLFRVTLCRDRAVRCNPCS